MEESILLTRQEASEVLRVLERVVDVSEKAGRDNPDAAAAFGSTAVKLLPDLFLEQ